MQSHLLILGIISYVFLCRKSVLIHCHVLLQQSERSGPILNKGLVTICSHYTWIPNVKHNVWRCCLFLYVYSWHPCQKLGGCSYMWLVWLVTRSNSCWTPNPSASAYKVLGWQWTKFPAWQEAPFVPVIKTVYYTVVVQATLKLMAILLL